MTKLSVNVNKIATLRNTRTINIPDITRLSGICLDAGAHGITVHPRPDERHIRPHDVHELAELVRSYPGREYNIEGNPFYEFIEYARAVHPDQCTLVPDTPEAFTSNHGWDLERDGERLKPIIDELHALGCRVSLFMDPAPEMFERIAEIGADRVELYTEPYAAAFARGEWSGELERYTRAARRAMELGLGVNAGHDLNRDNLPPFLAAVPEILEVSIGHALIADALEFGLHETVRLYLHTIPGNAPPPQPGC